MDFVPAPTVLHSLTRTIYTTLVFLALVAGLPAIAQARTLFVIEGFGWGHGVGLSQYGAYGLAQEGATYDGILATYYSGTELTTAEPAPVRVLLELGRKLVRVGSAAPFSVTDATGQKVDLPAGTATVAADFTVTIGGGIHALSAPLRFARGDEPLEFRRPYRGSLVLTQNGMRVRVVNEVPLEAYLYGVVPLEMPPGWSREALKAQAVAARSFALATRAGGEFFDVYDDTRSQVYGGIPAEDARASMAIDATAGQVLEFDGRIATTFFFSTSGGRTAAVEDIWSGGPIPYLRAVDDPTDAISPYHRWGPVVLSARELGSQLGAPAPRKPLDATTTRNPSGRADLFVVTGKRKQAAFTAGTVRSRLGLRSTGFDVAVFSLDAPVGTALYGRKLRLTGIARGIASPVLEGRAAGGGWERLAPLRVGKDGQFRATFRPRQGMKLRINAPVLESSERRLPTATLEVAPRITLSVNRRGRVFRGRVVPKSAGVVVRLERLGRSGWRGVNATTVRDSGDFVIKRERRRSGEFRATVSLGVPFAPGVSSTAEVPG